MIGKCHHCLIKGEYVLIYVNTEKAEFKLFNTLPCTVVNNNRDDGLIDVYIPTYNIFILLEEHELESDD